MMRDIPVRMSSTLVAIAFLLSTLFALSLTLDQPPALPKHYIIVLFGATGDLAQKYLWSGLFALFNKEFVKGKVHFTIYGVGRTNQSDGRKIVGDVLLKAIRCYDDKCRAVKTEFVQAVQYHSLKTEDDYKQLSDKMAENILSQYGLKENQTSYEVGRMFYMSIPPSVVAKTLKRVKGHLMPRAGHPWVRIVLEKPFGRDKRSAQNLARKLSELFTDEQVYRVDHYLGKPIVKLILPFRYINRELYEPLWSRLHVERVEVVMKEKLSCSGRLSFYDEVGVVRDVMQNHLTEMMLLIAMDIPHNSGNISEILEKKLAVLRQVRPISKKGVLYGQYFDYKASVIQELEKPDYESLTPTFAASVMHIDSPRWRGVPFVLMSGKQMDEKSSYIRVVFKDDMLGVEETPVAEACSGKQQRKQVVFHIASGALHRPELILVSPGLPRPQDAQIWEHEDLKMNVSVFGEDMSSMHKLLPAVAEEAYSSLLIAAFHGQRHLFTTADILMASWDVWSPVVTSPITNSDLRSYDVRTSLSTLNFKINNRKLEFTTPPSGNTESKVNTADSHLTKDSTYLGHSMVGGSVDSIIAQLAIDIVNAASRAVNTRDVFHLALSGGNSPVDLLKHLIELEDGVNFPWHQTHIWQVDERCVSSESIHSNFAALNTYLLRHIPIPYHHIHPIPVHLREEPCQLGDEVALFYETAIHRYLPSGEFDFVVLGIGTDGHTASLFPNHASLKTTNKMVVFSDGGPAGAISKRVSLTLEAINKSRQIGILVTGTNKKAILMALEETDGANVSEFPILGVIPVNGNLTFYLDQAALSKN